MEITNVSKDGTQQTYDQLFCSAKALTDIREHLITPSVLNILLSITAILGNTLIQIALHKESSLHPPTKLLLRSLSASDLCVGLTAGPVFATTFSSSLKEDWDICRFAVKTGFIANFFLYPLSLLTLSAISVDRLLALLLGLRYRQVVTLRRTWVTVVTIWTLSSLPSTIYLWNEQVTLTCGAILTSLCLLISVFSYTKIFLNLRHHRSQVQDHGLQQANLAGQLNIARYRKAVYSALWLQLTLVVCYLPAGIVQVVLMTKEFCSSLYLAGHIVATLVYLNSTLNPILYCWKIKEVRQAVKDTIRPLCCLSM